MTALMPEDWNEREPVGQPQSFGQLADKIVLQATFERLLTDAFAWQGRDRILNAWRLGRLTADAAAALLRDCGWEREPC